MPGFPSTSSMTDQGVQLGREIGQSSIDEGVKISEEKTRVNMLLWLMASHFE